MKFNINDRVILTDLQDKFFPAKGNPTKSSVYGCEGSIRLIRSRVITVVWDNGHENVYFENSLDYASLSTTNPDISSLNSIW